MRFRSRHRNRFFGIASLCSGIFVGIGAWQAQAAVTELSGGVNYRSFDYQEELRAPFKSTEKAIFFAPFVRARFPIPRLQESFFQLQGEMSGNVHSHFDGTTQQGVPVTDTNILAFADFDALLFWNFSPELYLQAGLGYHHWNRFLSGGSGYREIYTWFYMPIGILYQHSISEQIRIGVDISYRLMFQGEIKVIFSETVTTGDDTTLTLGNRPGYRFQFPVDYFFTNSQLGLLLAPWYEYSEIGESDYKYNSTPTTAGVLGYIQEPASKTQQFGLTIGLTGRF